MRDNEHKLPKRQNATFHEDFSQASSTDVMKLLPWCFSSTVPLHYMSNVLAIAMQQEEDFPVTIAVPEPEKSQAPDPSDSPVHQTETLPLQVPPLQDITFVGIPPVGYPFAGFIASPAQEKWDHFPSSSLGDHHYKRTHVDSQEVRLGVNTVLYRVKRTHLHWH